MFCLGVTGGIGSGKSYVSRIFAAMDVPVYEADSQTKLLYERDVKLRLALIALLGGEIYRFGMLQKEVMAAKIFSDPNLLAQVNRLVHPVVIDDFSLWKAQQKAPYVVIESAIILETPFALVANRMLTVSAPFELRLERLCHRDPTCTTDVRRRIEKQWSDAMREAKSDYVVRSDGKIPLLPQILAIHYEMLELSKRKNGCR